MIARSACGRGRSGGAQPGDEPENDDRKTAFDDEARAQQRLRPWRVLFLE
jgi:hypothetical protein